MRIPRTRWPSTLAAAGALLLGGPVHGQAPPVPEPMQRLQALVGRWASDRVEFLDREGAVIRTAGATARNELALGGRVLVHRGRLDDPEIETRGWYWWDPATERIHMGSVSASGRYDEFVGGWEGERLVMTTAPGAAEEGPIFRMTHDRFTADGYRERLEISDDGGRSWRTTSRQHMRRVDDGSGDADRILTAMDAWTGRWESDRKTGSDGRTFHFEYVLTWMDPGRTVTRMVIRRVGPGDAVSTVFEGYKGREPDGDGVYYVAASPSGRGSRGHVVLEGETLVTRYEGWTAEGDVVEIRDVFEPVVDGSFTSRTYLRDGAAAGWRQVAEDRWTRVGDA